MEGHWKVSVTVKGTQIGTTTNAVGRFQLSVPSTGSVELVFLLWDMKHNGSAGSRNVLI